MPPDGSDWADVGDLFSFLTGSFLTGLLAWFTQRKRAQIDESAVLLSSYKGLLESHKEVASAEIKSVRDQLARTQQELADLRLETARQIAEIEERHAKQLAEMRETHAADVRARQEIIEGLTRQIAQNSQSSAFLMGHPGDVAITKAARKRRGDDQND